MSPELDGSVIKIPTAHIVGKKDNLLPAGLALHQLCDKSTSALYQHAQGHEIPRDTRTTIAMAAIIKSTIDKALLLQ